MSVRPFADDDGGKVARNLNKDAAREHAFRVEAEEQRNQYADALKALSEYSDQLEAALREIAELQPRMVATLQKHGVVFDGPLGADPKNFQHVAFSIYTTLCEADSLADQALSTPKAVSNP